jgi:anaerobic dimethyl sulfoxide reductase subunit B (iron-sulfur subunit)
MPQYGFFFDQSRCTACHACTVACKSWNMIPPGPVKWAKLFEWETGTFPNLKINAVLVHCYHCENPVCVDAANGAMYKEEKYGAVLIDPDKATSPNMRAAWEACPYGAVVFDSDAPDAKASSCTMCVDRLEQNLLPACVTACPMRALDFGPLEDLQKKYGASRDLPDLPSSEKTRPSAVFKATDEKKQYVPYDVSKALQLLANRDPYPPFYAQPSDVTEVPEGVVKRNRMILKPKSTQELMEATRHDEG